MNEDDSDTEQSNIKKLIEKMEKNPYYKKYESFKVEIDNLIINTEGLSINQILFHTITTFFELRQNINIRKISFLKNKLSMLYHKLHQIYFFNLLITYCNFIEQFAKYISSERNEVQFNPSKDIIYKAIYDKFLNKNLENKIFSLRITSNSERKFAFLKKILEKYIYNIVDPFKEYNINTGPYPDGFELIIYLRDSYLILNDESNKKELIQNMKDLFKKYGINEKYINWWKNNSYARQLKNYEIIEDKGNDKKVEETIFRDEKKTKLIIEQNKEKYKKLIQNLEKQEINIKSNFKLTNKNFLNFKESFYILKKIIISIPNLTYKIKDIYPYGSISQLTQNKNSDYEISIITNNYDSMSNSNIEILFKEISSYIETNNQKEYKIDCIRTTKRTSLLLIYDKNYNINIEINCNNIFSLLNSNLIYKYLTYDARALILVNTIKDWSKIKGINSNHEGFMSSYCYTLMTIFFLQRLKNPLLPIIHSNNNLNKIFVNNKEYFIEKNLLCPEKGFEKFKTKNEDTVSTLLLKFFIFYLYLFNENDYCIDINNDKLTFRYNDAKYLNYFGEKNKVSVYCFIDMFDYTYNPGCYMDRNSTPHKLYIKKLQKSLIQLLNGENNLLKPDFEIVI